MFKDQREMRMNGDKTMHTERPLKEEKKQTMDDDGGNQSLYTEV